MLQYQKIENISQSEELSQNEEYLISCKQENKQIQNQIKKETKKKRGPGKNKYVIDPNQVKLFHQLICKRQLSIQLNEKPIMSMKKIAEQAKIKVSLISLLYKKHLAIIQKEKENERIKKLFVKNNQTQLKVIDQIISKNPFITTSEVFIKFNSYLQNNGMKKVTKDIVHIIIMALGYKCKKIDVLDRGFNTSQIIDQRQSFSTEFQKLKNQGKDIVFFSIYVINAYTIRLTGYSKEQEKRFTFKDVEDIEDQQPIFIKNPPLKIGCIMNIRGEVITQTFNKDIKTPYIIQSILQNAGYQKSKQKMSNENFNKIICFRTDSLSSIEIQQIIQIFEMFQLKPLLYPQKSNQLDPTIWWFLNLRQLLKNRLTKCHSCSQFPEKLEIGLAQVLLSIKHSRRVHYKSRALEQHEKYMYKAQFRQPFIVRIRKSQLS